MKLSRDLWLKVEPLLTTALDMEADVRGPWLLALEATHPEAAPVLRRMLAAHDRAERRRELETVPRMAPAPPWSSTHAPGARIGPFQLVRPLGHGGMGEVWLARQADGRVARDVALKLPALHQQGDVWRERFRRERDILAKLEHPHIARLYDAGVTDTGQPWLAMEFVEGMSLSEQVASRPHSIPERLALFRQVLAAVAHAHRHLVVHRDLKPANIMVDASGQVKLLDFGIAKLVAEAEGADSAELTRFGGRVMTLRYAAPEQVAGDIITTATDIYALGVILHELATGLSPYRAVREGKPLTDAMLRTPAAAPSSLLAGSLARPLAGDLDAIILKALRQEPAARYASVELFDQDILAHLEKRPVKAHAGTWRYLAGRFTARHKLPLAMAAAVLVTLLGGLVMAERERRVAVAEKARAERHFASVRKLANSFIFDVHSEIEDLAGSLKAREMLVKTSLEYLDALVGEAGGDAALMYELAAAYRKIGNIQGQPGGANTGDLTASLANFEKSKRLFAALDALKPNDIEMLREHASLSFALARAYFLKPDARWQPEIAATIQLAARVAALPGATPRDRARAAGAMAEQAHLTSLIHGHSAEVEATVDRAIATLEALSRELPAEAGVRQNLASTYQRAGDILSGAGKTPESVRAAVAYYRKALDLFRNLHAAKPGDQRLRNIALEVQVALAETLAVAGEIPEARRTIAEAVTRAAELRAADPKNADLAVAYLGAHRQAAMIANRAGDRASAIRHAREALASVARLPEDTRKSRDMRNTIAEAKAQLGIALVASAEAPGLERSWRLALLAEARVLLADAVAFIAEIRTEKLGSYDASDAKEIVDALARCDAAIARLKAHGRREIRAPTRAGAQ